MFDPRAFIEEQVASVKESVDGKAIIAGSGGVDSTAAAAIAGRALGDRLLAVYVDTGLMRKGETADVEATLSTLGIHHKVLRAADEYFAVLQGIIDPERKRVLIGNKFIEIFEREASGFGASFLVLGSIAPDWFESGGQLRERI